MFRKPFMVGAALLVAATLVLLTPKDSFAQRGGAHRGGHGWIHHPLHHGGYHLHPVYRPHYGNVSYGYGYNPYYSSPPYSYPGFVPGIMYDPASNFYYPLAPNVSGGWTSAGASAHITVTVPANATVWFDGAATTFTGTERQYITPPLSPGRQYTFWVRARWTERREDMNQLQPVEVTAGSIVYVRFPTPAGRP